MSQWNYLVNCVKAVVNILYIKIHSKIDILCKVINMLDSLVLFNNFLDEGC